MTKNYVPKFATQLRFVRMRVLQEVVGEHFANFLAAETFKEIIYRIPTCGRDKESTTLGFT